MRPSLPFAAALLASLAAACSPARPDAPSGPLDRLITEAAAAHGVPRDLMVAVAHVEGGLRLAEARDVGDDELVAVAGVLELRRGRYDSLARGAELAGVPAIELQRDRAKGTDAGARVLD